MPRQVQLFCKTAYFQVGLRKLHGTWKMVVTRLGCFYVTAILSWGYGWGWIEDDIEAEVDLKFEPEVEMRLRWDWVKV